jgi:RimJ/RimL family protein N-acetyltransferase
MRLIPLDTPQRITLVADWLARPENYQWLDFGGQALTPALVKVMAQRETNVLRIFTADDDETPIGVVGLSDVDRHFKTGTLWAVLGDRSYARRGLATRAVSKMLTLGFGELGLAAINSWAVEHNPSIPIGKYTNFRLIGRQRQCHYVDGQPYDRLLFDILASEHQEM